MSNYMRMANMIPELEDLVETGIPAKAYPIQCRIKSLFGSYLGFCIVDKEMLDEWIWRCYMGI